MEDYQKYYNYEDVFILPKYSDVLTRSEVDTSVLFESQNSKISFILKVPIISANMDSVTENELARSVYDAGGIGALHRFMPIKENVEEFLEAIQTNLNTEENLKLYGYRNSVNPLRCLVSIGVNKDYQQRAEALYEAGASLFIVDIAHGHSRMMMDVVGWLRKRFNNTIFIVAGNVTTPQAVKDLESWGVDAIKIGIGPGAVCTTKDVTGVTMPIFTAIQNCARVANVPIIADGGAKVYGDIAKAIGAGATAVMSGYFFAGCNEVPSVAKQFDANGNEQFIYRGMASSDAMKKVRSENLPTPEGKSIAVNPRGPAFKVVQDIQGGLRSAYSYVGARTTKDFQTKVEFGLRRRNQP